MAVAHETFQHLTTAGLAEVDPADRRAAQQELERQRGQIELIASENFTWPSVLEAVGSVPTNKYAEGYPGKRYYGGCEIVDQIEQTAIDRAKELFGAEHANVQPHAGAQTNMAVYMAALQPGDTILSLELAHGGHLTHGLKVNFSGRLYTIAHYGVSRETNVVDYDEVLRLAKERAPEADRLRRQRVSAHGRHRRVPEDRGRGRRAAALRHGALRRARRGRPAPEPGRRLRLRHVDDAQDAGRARARASSSARRSTRRRSTARSSRDAGRSARAHDRGEGDVLQDRDDRRVPRLPAAGARERGRALRDADRGRPRRPHRRHRHAPAPARPALDGLDGQGRGGAAARGQAHGEPQHGSVRRAAADGRVGRAHRDAGGDDARLRRGRLPRGRRRSSSARSRETPTSTRCAARRGAVREAAAVPGLPRLHDATSRDAQRCRRPERRAHARHASARPAQALVPARQARRRRSTSASSSRRSRCS